METGGGRHWEARTRALTRYSWKKQAQRSRKAAAWTDKTLPELQGHLAQPIQQAPLVITAPQPFQEGSIVTGTGCLFCSIALLLQARSRMPAQCCQPPAPHPHKMSSTRTRNLAGSCSRQPWWPGWLGCTRTQSCVASRNKV